MNLNNFLKLVRMRILSNKYVFLLVSSFAAELTSFDFLDVKANCFLLFGSFSEIEKFLKNCFN